MKYAILLATLLASSAFANDTYTQGYFRRDGTWVQPHYQTAPDNNIYNNYSTQGNSNPYTGQQGYVNPYANSYTPPVRQPICQRDYYGNVKCY